MVGLRFPKDKVGILWRELTRGVILWCYRPASVEIAELETVL